MFSWVSSHKSAGGREWREVVDTTHYSQSMSLVRQLKQTKLCVLLVCAFQPGPFCAVTYPRPMDIPRTSSNFAIESCLFSCLGVIFDIRLDFP